MPDSLANNDVKYVSYAIVFTKPGKEQVMPCGEGSMVLTDAVSESQFIAMLTATYWGGLRKDAETDPAKAKCLQTAEALIREPDDHRYLKVYFVNPATWPREPLDKERRQEAALKTLRWRIREL